MSCDSDIKFVTQPGDSKRVQWSYTLPDTTRPHGALVLRRAMKRFGPYYSSPGVEGFEAKLNNDGVVRGSYSPLACAENEFARARSYIEALAEEASQVERVVMVTREERKLEDARREAFGEFRAAINAAIAKLRDVGCSRSADELWFAREEYEEGVF